MTVSVFLLERIFFKLQLFIETVFYFQKTMFFICFVKKTKNAKTTEKLFRWFLSDFYTIQLIMQFVQHLFQITIHSIVFLERILIHLPITNATFFKRRIRFLKRFFFWMLPKATFPNAKNFVFFCEFSNWASGGFVDFKKSSSKCSGDISV